MLFGGDLFCNDEVGSGVKLITRFGNQKAQPYARRKASLRDGFLVREFGGKDYRLSV
jgi:hypothetical protein